MITLIDYGMGNLLSVGKAFESVGASVSVTSDPARIASGDALVLPGVGNFGDGMRHLTEYGLVEPIVAWIRSGRPFLGICLGMQMLMDASEEAPGIPGLGVFKGNVVRFPRCGEKVPHMGWNELSIRIPHPFLEGVSDRSHFYFVHSYHVAPEDSGIAVGTCDYIHPFPAVIGRGNIFATQFHPEKSQNVGLRILENFVRCQKSLRNQPGMTGGPCVSG
jgi:glutamine amidotransferase